MKKRVNVSPGGRKKRIHRKGAGGPEKSSARKDELGEVTEYRVLMSHDSRHWLPNVNECDAFGPVTVYDAQGKVKKVITRSALLRPWQARNGNTWNDRLFSAQGSDRV